MLTKTCATTWDEYRKIWSPLFRENSTKLTSPKNFITFKTTKGIYCSSPADKIWEIAATINLNEYSHIVDLGSGTGTVLFPFAIQGLPAIGLECSTKLFQASKNIKENINQQFPKMAEVNIMQKDLSSFHFNSFKMPIIIYYYFNHDLAEQLDIVDKIKTEAPANSLIIYNGPFTIFRKPDFTPTWAAINDKYMEFQLFDLIKQNPTE